jgi:hypothetical protein
MIQHYAKWSGKYAILIHGRATKQEQLFKGSGKQTQPLALHLLYLALQQKDAARQNWRRLPLLVQQQVHQKALE